MSNRRLLHEPFIYLTANGIANDDAIKALVSPLQRSGRPGNRSAGAARKKAGL